MSRPGQLFIGAGCDVKGCEHRATHVSARDEHDEITGADTRWLILTCDDHVPLDATSAELHECDLVVPGNVIARVTEANRG